MSRLTLCVAVALGYAAPGRVDERGPDAPRTEGKWEVTPVGRSRDRLYHPHFAAQHRLLIAIDGEPGQLWDTQAGKRVAILADQKGVDWADISPDGATLLTADRLGGKRYFRDPGQKNEKVSSKLRLWELSTGKLLKTIEVDLSAPELRDSTDWKLRWCDKGTVLIQLDLRQNPARASVRTVLGHLDLTTGKVAKWSPPIPGGESLHHSPDGKRALAGRSYGVWRQADGEVARGGAGTTFRVDLMDVTEGKVIATLDERQPEAKDHSIIHRVWSSDSGRIATVGSDHTIGIWDGQTGKPISAIKGHKDWVIGITFSPDGKTVLTASEDETARIWETATGKSVRAFRGHTAGLNDAVFDRTGARVLTCGEDETARLWDTATGKQIRAWGGHESAVRAVGFGEGDATIWTRTVRGVRRVWKIDGGSLVSESKTGSVGGDRFGVLYLKGTGDKGYEVWSGPPGAPGEGRGDDGSTQLRPRLSVKGKGLFSFRAVTSDGKMAASVGPDCTVYVWDLERWDKVTGEGRTVLPAQPDEVRRLGFSPDGKTLAVACKDGSIRLWDVAARKERLKFEGAVPDIESLTFSPDGTVLAGGNWEKSLFVWKVATGKLIWSQADETGPIHSLAFSPNGKTLASAGLVRDPNDKEQRSFYKPGEIILWDVVSGKKQQTLTGFRTAVACVAFTPGGKTLVASDYGNELSVWDVEPGKRRTVLKGAGSTADYLAISPDGKLLVSAHGFSDGIEFWDISIAEEIGRLRSPAGRGGEPVFTPDGRTLIVSGSHVQLWDVADVRKSFRLSKPIPD